MMLRERGVATDDRLTLWEAQKSGYEPLPGII